MYYLEDDMITEQASIEHDKWLDVVKELRHKHFMSLKKIEENNP